MHDDESCLEYRNSEEKASEFLRNSKASVSEFLRNIEAMFHH